MDVRAHLASRVPDRWRWIAFPLAIALFSRVYSIVLLLHAAGPGPAGPPLAGGNSPLVAWDGQWYLHIANTGYHAAAVGPNGHRDFAFQPGWPLLVRLASVNGALPMGGTAVVLANVLFVLAAVVVFQLFVERFGERTAVFGTLLLCFNPAAYVFSMAYSEALFVLLCALYFYDRYGRLAPAFAGLATIVRISGLALAASAAVMLALRRRPARRLLSVMVVAGVAFALWWIFIWQLTGSFGGWFLGSPAWDRDQGIQSIASMWGHHRSWVIAWLALVVVMIAGCVILLRRHTDLAIFGLVAIAMSLIGAPVWSMPRHSMVAFPAFAAIADKLGPRLSFVLLVAFAVGQYVYVDRSFGVGVSPPSPP
jgi:hypothetical protein